MTPNRARAALRERVLVDEGTPFEREGVIVAVSGGLCGDAHQGGGVVIHILEFSELLGLFSLVWQLFFGGGL